MGQWSMDILIVFLVVFFIVFMCSFIRKINMVFRSKTAGHVRHLPAQRNMVITTIEIPTERITTNGNNGNVLSTNVQTNPPAYPVDNELPPTYDEAVKAIRARQDSLPSYKE